MTLIETVVFLAIFSVIVIAIVSSIRFVYRGQRYSFETADATRSARLGIEQAIQDIRETAYSDIGDYPVVAMATSSITFFSDVDRDTKIERIRYYIENDMLKRGELEAVNDPPEYLPANEVVSTIAPYVRNEPLGVPLFTYYDKSGAEMADLADVTSVSFILARLVINIEPSRAPNDFELRSSAALRNIISQ